MKARAPTAQSERREGLGLPISTRGGGRWMGSRGPLFSVGDEVEFETMHHSLAGTIAIVDYRGRERDSFDGCDWSYDIFVESHPGCGGGPALHKHIPESRVAPARPAITRG